MNLIDTKSVSRIGWKVFSLLLAVIMTACSTAVPQSIPTAPPTAGVPVTGPTAQATPPSDAVLPTAAGTPAPVDMSKVTPKPFDAQMQAELEAYIATVMEREHVPGAAVAIVQDGQVVYQEGFGVRELGKPDPVTPETLMMIGSTGKSMTTMMMGTVVEDGLMGWDTPATEILPTFAVSDPSLTPRITMRHLVCNCTGVEQRDLVLSFSNRPRTAEEMVESLRTFSFTGEFGTSYQYSNQMVATGGYLAARAASPAPGSLMDDYRLQMQQRVFDPIGMENTTFSFEAAQAHPDRATPHGRTADLQFVPIPLSLEQTLEVVGPAGASWSTVEDLGRYLITQMSQGVAPDGERVISSENLIQTWQPQVQISPNAWYALGWVVGDFKGAPLLNHGGGTIGFTSVLTFLPDANLGIAVLTNAQNNSIPTAVFVRVLELAYGLPMEADARYADREAQAQQAVQDQLAQLPPELDVDAVAPYAGDYTNPDLGEARLSLKDSRFILEADTFTTELRSAGNGAYLAWDPPWAGSLKVQLEQDDAGQAVFQLILDDPDQPGTYLFTQMPLSAQWPGAAAPLAFVGVTVIDATVSEAVR